MTSPLAYPLAWPKLADSSWKSQHLVQTVATTCSALMEYPMRATPRAGRAVARRCRRRLSERDLALLGSVGKYRYMTALQIEELHFFGHASRITGARTCRRVLERMTQAGLLWRLERRIGGVRAGSASFVYALAPLGQRIIDPDGEMRVRYREPSEEFLEHTLAVAQLAVDLNTLARGSDDLGILALDAEPGCWRHFNVGFEGVQTLKPDLSVSLRVGEFEYRWFVEVDLSTHSGAAVVRKCRIYDRYWQTGIEQDRSGLFPRVLLVTPSLRRATLIERSISGAQHLNHDLFAVTTSNDALKWLAGEAS